jgi:flagellar protein FlbT
MLAEAIAANRQNNAAQEQILAGLANVERLVGENRKFEALKAIRALLPIEAEIIAKTKALAPEEAA